MNIVLIGMRSSGKSNIARRLSVFTKRSVFSTDFMITYENRGESISTILEKNSGDWRVFRELEYLIIKKAVIYSDLIIDTGGGVVVDVDQDGNEMFSQRKVDLLKENGLVIWLKGDIEVLAKKSGIDPERPVLNQGISHVELMQRRLPFYEKSADIIIEIDGKKRRKITHEIMGHLGNHPDFDSLDYFKPKE